MDNSIFTFFQIFYKPILSESEKYYLDSSIFLQHASNLPNNITAQVEALNKLVTDYCIPQICGEADAYIKYKNDVSTLSVPLQRPVSTYQNNVLETTNFF